MHRRLLEDHTIHNQLRCGTEETDDGCVACVATHKEKSWLRFSEHQHPGKSREKAKES
jgi:hypothetical protein